MFNFNAAATCRSVLHFRKSKLTASAGHFSCFENTAYKQVKAIFWIKVC